MRATDPAVVIADKPILHIAVLNHQESVKKNIMTACLPRFNVIMLLV